MHEKKQMPRAVGEVGEVGGRKDARGREENRWDWSMRAICARDEVRRSDTGDRPPGCQRVRLPSWCALLVLLGRRSSTAAHAADVHNPEEKCGAFLVRASAVLSHCTRRALIRARAVCSRKYRNPEKRGSLLCWVSGVPHLLRSHPA